MKWHLPSSSAAEHRGKTDKAIIREHKATWDYSKEIELRLTIEKNQALQECEIHFEILQEYHEGVRGGRVLLGNVRLNLAEYTRIPDPSTTEGAPLDDGEEGGITRRYLLQDSKVNSTLKVGIKMKQIEGDNNFVAPPLKSAMVLGGIAGIIGAEAGEGDDIPTLTSRTRELSEAQDIYRRTLAATWACQTGELPPDKLIEDLFAGGDGGRMQPPPKSPRQHSHNRIRSTDDSVTSGSSDNESRQTITPSHLTPDRARSGHRRADSYESSITHVLQPAPSISGRASIDEQMKHNPSEHRRKGHSDWKELTEFDLRDDLKSWQVSVR